MHCSSNRWPPVYDFKDLQSEIQSLIARGLEDGFYKANPNFQNYFQGDIVEIDMDFPFIDENGDIASIQSKKWLILGNTCDLTRDELVYTNIIPLDELDNDVPSKIISDLKRFQNYKKVFFPDLTKEYQGYIADFTQVCSIEKKFLFNKGKKVSELEYYSWVLFHSCIVRYFARDDGRND